MTTHMPALARLGGATVVGVIVAVALVVSHHNYAAPQTGWDAAVLTYLAVTVPAIWRLDPEATAEKARHEDPTRPLADLLLLGAAVASLATLAVVIVRANASTGAAQLVLTILAVASVVLSWALVHVTYTLRYARIYYTPPVGGVDFNQDERPSYADFAYLAFTIGMTFQVSDTALRSRAIRSTALRHALLSYLFGTVILATTVNFVAGLAR